LTVTSKNIIIIPQRNQCHPKASAMSEAQETHDIVSAGYQPMAKANFTHNVQQPSDLVHGIKMASLLMNGDAAA